MSKPLEAIGIDLGGTKIEIGRVNQNGELLQSIRFATNSYKGPEKIQEEILAAVQKLQSVASHPISGIGIGVAGQIDAVSGMVHFAPNLPNWRDIPLQANIEARLNIPVKVINDVRAITWGEWLFGAGKQIKDVVCVFVGTGIGGGVVSQGNLLTGYSNSFAEVGHMAINLEGPPCTCGNIGCWEALAGGWGIAQQAQQAILHETSKGYLLLKLSQGNIKDVSAKTVVEAFRQGDPLALHLMQNVQQALVAGCVNLINLYNPECLILGGGLIDGVPELIPHIDEGIKQRALKVATQNLRVIPAQLGKQVGVIGAAAVVLHQILKDELKK